MNKPPLSVLNVSVLTLTPLLALTVVPVYGFYVGYDLIEWLVFFLFLWASGLSVTGGYHRLWAHRSYEAHVAIRLCYAIWGAAAVQNSVFYWASDHRRHHRYVDDSDLDPYSARRGFWYAHMGWILRDYHPNSGDFSNIKDLQRDPILQWQHKHYLALVLATNLGLPLLIGYLHGKLWGTFLLAGLLRLVVNHHLTFLVNSLAHFWGRRPYSEANSSRDNSLLALLTYGEGYHNYHHHFQYDYRNGNEWWHFDPTKWLIKAMTWLRLTHKLQKASRFQIEKAKVERQFRQALFDLENQPQQENVRYLLQHQYQRFIATLTEWGKLKQDGYEAKRRALHKTVQSLDWRLRRIELHHRLKVQRKQWRILLDELIARPVTSLPPA
jgi:stearoyl-CoA desaturase (delta-9 desaturase)